MLTAREMATVDDGNAPNLPVPAPVTPARAAATAVGRAADRLYRLAVQPLAVVPGGVTLAELPELVPNPSLLMVMQGRGDLIGMIALCPEAVTALIEIQTLGRITSRIAAPRRLTRSDAMICSDFVNTLMEELTRELAGVEGFDGIAGYRYASYLDDMRPLSLMLEDRPFRSLVFDLHFGGSATRKGKIFLAIPQGEEPARKRPAVQDAQIAATGPGAKKPVPRGARKTLGRVVDEAPIELHGILCRRKMSLGDLRALTAGKLLPLSRVSLSDARLETARGQYLGRGKFGEADGCHAIRLHRKMSGAASPATDLSRQTDMGTEPPMDDIARPDPFRASPQDQAAKTADSGLESAKSPTKVMHNG
ncbi:FliM/FliN family flagellar motor C-terminal domain-containing protein [Paracoccus sp. Z330]|uniref:FliM/FliN family flagellar motor C-terminal domain-containing protein n=1 Tax=Paracoccus onchidii TaxID=3017813 RepID=A0ABT4ZK66_9RHOB|nr:FliM/FliN family flagellar motor C-terminal domain-containing protein [Paracoccus onchidii]MDB6179462.1 FliM/FliN family flagellar motor C-terminal domain-containing protein [Paracoccus onchidii]